MKLWQAIGVQLLASLLREHPHLPARHSSVAEVPVTCNCTETSKYPGIDRDFLLFFAGLSVGIATGVVLGVLFCLVSQRRSNVETISPRPRRRGGGVVTEASARFPDLALVQ